MKNFHSHLNHISLTAWKHMVCGALILLFCSSLMTFYGCSKKPACDITFAVGGAPAELDFWQELIADFKKQTNIKVDMLRQPTDMVLLISDGKRSQQDTSQFKSITVVFCCNIMLLNLL